MFAQANYHSYGEKAQLMKKRKEEQRYWEPRDEGIGNDCTGRREEEGKKKVERGKWKGEGGKMGKQNEKRKQSLK